MSVDNLDDGEEMLEGLLAAGPPCAPDELPRLIAAHAARAGLYDAVIYLADLQKATLRPLRGDLEVGACPDGQLGIDATLAGRAFRDAEPIEAPQCTKDDASTEEADDLPEAGYNELWVPLLDGAERLGVLRVTVRARDDAALRRASRLASLTSLFIVSKRARGDNYARLVRAHRMSLAAEVQWTLMPVPALATPEVSICGVLEPAYEVGGDAFDFALAGPIAHLSIFDAMGHDLSSSLIASIAMGSSRNNRRRGAGLIEISDAIDDAVGAQYDQTRFVTGVLGGLDTRTGELTWINRGHPSPLLIRRARSVIELECPPTPPMGVGLDATPTLCRDQLEPGDRLLLYTDGIIEARDPDGELFGLDRFTDFIIRSESASLSAPETLRRLMRAVLQHHDDELRDDATVLLAEWHPPAGDDSSIPMMPA